MTSGEDVDFCIRLRRRFGNPSALLTRPCCSTSIAARMRPSGNRPAGMAPAMRCSTSAIRDGSLPSPHGHMAIALVRLVSARRDPADRLGPGACGCAAHERAEFEHYHRQWMRHFWAGFFEQWRKRPA